MGRTAVPVATVGGVSDQGDWERRIAELEQWKDDHAKRLEEWCSAMTDWCREEHREVEHLKSLLSAVGAALDVPPSALPPPRPPSGR